MLRTSFATVSANLIIRKFQENLKSLSQFHLVCHTLSTYSSKVASNESSSIVEISNFANVWLEFLGVVGMSEEYVQ